MVLVPLSTEGAMHASLLIEVQCLSLATTLNHMTTERPSLRGAAGPAAPYQLVELRVRNVKGFRDQQSLRITPISLMFGANSAGKSTLIQTLVMLKQTLTAPRSETRDSLELRGPEVDLGGYKTLISDHAVDSDLHIGLTLSTSHPDLSDSQHRDLALELSFRWDASQQRVCLSSTSATLRGRLIAFRRDKELRVADRRSASNLVAMFRESVPDTSRVFSQVSESDFKWLVNWVGKYPCQDMTWLAYWSPVEYGPGRQGRPFGGSAGSPRNQLLSFFLDWWHHQAWMIMQSLRRCMADLVHVGPLREMPRRVASEGNQGAGICLLYTSPSPRD